MSHELRTPLNSILILGQQLAENADGNLSTAQVEFAKTIHGAGTDLLNLISDILDLSKIESGTVTVECEELLVHAPAETIERNFRHEAESRKLSFTTDFDPRLGRAITTDSKRLLQVLKNLLSNAFKFTERGGVRLHVGVATGGWTPEHPTLSQVPPVVEFSVSDTGIGIPPEKQKHHLRGLPAGRCGHGAQVRRHRPGAGDQPRTGAPAGRRDPPEQRRRAAAAPSRSTCRCTYVGPAYSRGRQRAAAAAERRAAGVSAGRAAGGRARKRSPMIARTCSRATPVLLVVEDDPHYARVLLNLARDRGFKVLLARDRHRCARCSRASITPTAISLDVFLPDMLGWTVLNQLKRSSDTRHIPVQILTIEDERQYGLERGAFSFITKTGDDR